MTPNLTGPRDGSWRKLGQGSSDREGAASGTIWIGAQGLPPVAQDGRGSCLLPHELKVLLADRHRVADSLRRQPKLRAVLAASLLTGGLLSALGCGNTYRPVVTAVNPVGPAAQPTKYAIAISQPTPTGPGLVTFVDFSGDSILNTTALGVAPYYLALNQDEVIGSNASTAYTLNRDGTINSFSLSPTTLLANNIQSSTLLPGAVLPTSVFSGGNNVYVTDPARNGVGQFTGSPPALRQEFPVAANPIFIAGVTGASRVYAISQGTAGGAGQVAAIENTATPVTVSNTIDVGVDPVYGVLTRDSYRAFIMNQGSNSVSVINAQTNALDAATPTIAVGTAPVWGDLVLPRSELVVLNKGNGVSPGSLSLINIPLCNNVSLPSNPNCDPNNPTDAVGFGQVLATIPVGVGPSVVAVLQDGTRAYVANTGSTVTCPASLPKAAAILPTNGCGSVSVVDLLTNTVTATIPVAGHPNFIAATTGTPTGKVYTTSTETSLMTVLRTDTDQIQTYVDLQGTGQQVRVTQP